MFIDHFDVIAWIGERSITEIGHILIECRGGHGRRNPYANEQIALHFQTAMRMGLQVRTDPIHTVT
jgi:hypothetical protein